MSSRSSRKRLRVRLKATDRESLATTFGASLSEMGLFLRSKQLLPLGTKVVVELFYNQGELAIRGKGNVIEVVDDGADHDGMRMELKWSEGTRSTVEWVLRKFGEDETPANESGELNDPFEAVTVMASEQMNAGPPSSEDNSQPLVLAVDTEDVPESGPYAAEIKDPLEGDDIEQSGDRLDLVADLLEELPSAPAAKAPSEPELPIEEPLDEGLGLGQVPAAPVLPKESISLELEFEPPVEADEIRLEEAPELRIAQKRSPSTEYAFSPSAEEVSPLVEREPGEVTPLARIELVRAKPEPVQAAEVKPLLPESSESSTAIPSKLNRDDLPIKSVRAMAIDLGTSQTKVAVLKEGEPTLVPSRRGTESIPSIVMIQPEGKTIIGEPALRKMEAFPEFGVVRARNLIGRPFRSPLLQESLLSFDCQLCAGDEGEVAVAVGRHVVSLEEIYALIFKEVRESVVLSLNEHVNRGFLTCPIHFGHRQRQGLRVAAALAGIHTERMISEPLAAAIYHTVHKPGPERLVFVYHLGAGIFEATLIHVNERSYKVLEAKGGFAGGGDFDETIVKLLISRLEEAVGHAQKPSAAQRVSLRKEAERMKIELSSQESTTAELSAMGNVSFEVAMEMKRSSIEYLWGEMVERTLKDCAWVLSQAGVETAQVSDVILIGAQTQTPLVQRRVEAFFERPAVELDREHAAVLGAAEAAARLATDDELKLTEILSASFGVGLPTGKIATVIERGEALPMQRVFRLTESHVEESGGDLFIYQGDGGNLAEVELVGVLKIEIGAEVGGEIDVFFYVSEEGMLSLSAASLKTSEALMVKLHLEEPGVTNSKKGGIVNWLKRKFGVTEA